MLADHDLDVRAEIVFVAQNLDHAPARILGGRGPVGDLDVDHHVFQVVPVGAARGFLAQARGADFLSCSAAGFNGSRTRRGSTSLMLVFPDTPSLRGSRSPA